jgi:flagellar basal body rod protein FlgG
VPAGTSIQDLQVTAEGRILSGTVDLGQLELVEIQPQAPLQRAGASLIRVPDEYVQPASTTAVLQGALESSNVQSIEELVTIMIGSRQYEAAQRIIRSLSEAAQSHIHSQQGG